MNTWAPLNSSKSTTRKKIITDWERLLKNKHPEEKYHQFLAYHPAFFFYDIMQDTLVISKIKFGADFIADFVICYDSGSNGLVYELIELERPDIPLYTKSNKPSARLVHAIQQIQDWKMWLLQHANSINKLFPSSRIEFDKFLNLKFTIIISKRELNSEHEIEQRNLLSKSIGISIRSFDFLTEKLKKVVFTDDPIFNDNSETFTNHKWNKYLNPFHKAFSDKEWRNIIKNRKFTHGHMIENNMDILIENRSYNHKRFEQYCRMKN